MMVSQICIHELTAARTSDSTNDDWLQCPELPRLKLSSLQKMGEQLESDSFHTTSLCCNCLCIAQPLTSDVHSSDESSCKELRNAPWRPKLILCGESHATTRARDRWQGRWLQHTSDPRSPDARMRETLAYAVWFKQGEGMQWKDLPVYLSCMGHDGWRYIAQIRLGNYGLRVETGRWTRSPYDQRVCNRCQEADVEHD
jgi:hypothetical protein